jgi:hypothetical protein
VAKDELVFEGPIQALQDPTADQRLAVENAQLKQLLGEKALEMEILKKLSRL